MTYQNNFSHAATVFSVRDIQKSIDFYTSKLSFTLTFSWGKPTSYAVLKNGGIQIHLVERNNNSSPPSQHCTLYIFVHDIDKIYRKCVQEKIPVISSPENRDYQMKDFDIKDPDGYVLTFGNGR